MRLGILGRKIGMTQVFDEAGNKVPITVVDASDCRIVQVKSKETDGYSALQVSLGQRKPQNVNKARVGHFKKAETAAKPFIQEIRLEDGEDLSQFKPGQLLNPEMFQKGDRVDVIGTTIGKGFAGVMKRHHFSGKNASHGTHKYFRHGGSIGTNLFPGRVMKNRKMPGHMGNAKRTLQNSEVVNVLSEDKLLLLKGGIPGARNSIVLLQPARKKLLPKDRVFVK